MLLAISLLALKLSNGPVPLRITLEEKAIAVSADFPATEDQKVTFHLEDWAGVENFGSDIYFFKATGPDGKPIQTMRMTRTDWEVRNAGRPFHLSYAVI